MTDRMEFPKTMKEFIKGYSFKDNEEVYTNGAELIPVFRVEQALEHYENEIRAKVIDEFAEKLCEKFTYKSINVLLNGYETDILTLDGAAEIIVDIAEQMKAGAADE